MSAPFDVVVRNVRLVRPNVEGTPVVDVGICDGKFVAIEASLDATGAAEVIDGAGRFAFPGLVDPHFHVGIYAPIEEDARSESRAAAQGGVTTALTYFRTGEYYLNKGGPYAEFYPEVLERSKGNYWVDYAYHLAPINKGHIDEMPALLKDQGVSSFKIFMFYGGHGLHGRSDSQNSFLKLEEGERYDFAHFEFIMRQLTKMIADNPDQAESISLGLHCEMADILNAYTEIVQSEGKLTGLHAYNAARPPHSEGLAVFIASYLAYETACANINLLHLSSQKAMEAALMMQTLFPHINFRREVTVGHLVLDVDCPNGVLAKVNPPIRERSDVEFLWKTLLEGGVSWVASDHACCKPEMKYKAENPDDIWMAKSGFGGTEYLLSALYSEGVKRGLSLNAMAELVSWNAARRFGLGAKGDVAIGYDADLVLFDPAVTFTVRAAESESGQQYTPFEGYELNGKVTRTLLRGKTVFADGAIVGEPTGQYQSRPNVRVAS